MGSIAEVLSDEHGLVWPDAVAPYDVHVVALGESSQSNQSLQRVIKYLEHANLSALTDTRSEMRAGEKFADADLIGIPTRVVVSARSSHDSNIEAKRRTDATATRIPLESLGDFVKAKSSQTP